MSRAYKRYVLGIVTLVFGFNFLDRFLVTLFLQPIKDELRLSDTQLGFMTGIAFGVFYAILGLPIARWADRGNRVTITSIALGLWALTAMSAMLVVNFTQLIVIRICAAVGEAGCMPPTYSLLGDYFPDPTQRTRAMTVYWLAAPLAGLLGFVLGGWLNELRGWRVPFFAIGVPGLITAVVVRLTVVEPRCQSNRDRISDPKLPRMLEVVGTLWNQRSSRHVGLAIILLFAMGQGLTPWYAAFLIRSHAMSTTEVGVWLGLIFGLGGTVGISLGGYVAGRWFARSERRQMRLSAILIALLVPCFVLFLLFPEKHVALLALIPLGLMFNFILGPTFALMQRLVVDEMRATTLALVMLLANLIGMGLVPQAVGFMSDLLKPSLGVDSLRYAMLITSSIALWAAYHFWSVGGTVGEDLLAVSRVAGGQALKAARS